MPHVDFEKDVALSPSLALRGREDRWHGAYFLRSSTNLAEVAYMVVPEWQGSGLGAALQQRLQGVLWTEAAGIRGRALQANTAMLNLAKRW